MFETTLSLLMYFNYYKVQLLVLKSTQLSPEGECRHSIPSGCGLQYTDITVTLGLAFGHQLDWQTAEHACEGSPWLGYMKPEDPSSV